jgi:hypothetical protein
MNAFRIGLGGVILCTIALPYALLLAIPYSLRLVLAPFVKPDGETGDLGTLPQDPLSDAQALLAATQSSFVHRHQMSTVREIRNPASVSAPVRRRDSSHRTPKIAHHLQSRRTRKEVRSH